MCQHCRKTKSYSEFHKDKWTKDGYRNRCRVCISEMGDTKKWRQNNLEKIRKRGREYYKAKLAENPNAFRLKSMRWNEKQKKQYAINPEKYKEQMRRWIKRNPGAPTYASSITRAKKATPKWLTKEQRNEMKQFYIEAKELQWLSEEPLHVDHIHPLKGLDKAGKHISCGLHVPWNLQILPRSLNSKKGSKIAK